MQLFRASVVFVVVLCFAGLVWAQDIPADSGNQVVKDGESISGSLYGGSAQVANGDAASSDNSVEITDSEVSATIRGGSAEYSSPDSPGTGDITASNNRVVAENTDVGFYIKGGHAGVYNDSTPELTAAANNNHIEFDGGEVTDIWGGYVEMSGDGSGTANDNEILFKSGTATGRVTGGAVFGEGKSAVAGNTVTIQDGMVNDTIAGGVAESQGGDSSATGNSVTIEDGTVSIEDSVLFGGRAETSFTMAGDTATATGNTVTINGGTVTLKNVDDGDPLTENTALIGGMAELDSSGIATATENKVVITDGTVKVDGYGIAGGAAMADTRDSLAEGNTVTISGGEVEATNQEYGIAGAWAATDSGTATASNNTVLLSGGTVKGRVAGGFALASRGKAIATDNTVTIGGDVDLSAASLYGGGTILPQYDTNPENDFFTGNTLNKTSAAAVRDAQNFQYVNFGYAGDANIGTLDTTGGTVELNTNGYDIDFGGDITGTGSLAKFGAGAFTYGGSINVDGSVSVRGGSFVIDSDKTLSAGGRLLFGEGSVYTPNGNTLTVVGGVTIDGGARLNLSDIDIGKTILASNDGIDGFFDFDSLFYRTEMNSALTELSVLGEFNAGEKGKNIISELATAGVTVGKNGAKGIGQLASILDSVSPAVEAELMTRLQELVKLADSDRDAAAAGVQQIIGQYSTRATQATHTVAQSFGGAISGHLSQMRDTRMAMGGTSGLPGARSNAAYASLRDPRAYRSARGGYGYSAASQRIWGAGFGSFASQDNDDGEFGYDYNAGGFILGYDHYFGENITAGVTAAYSHGSIEGNEGLSETDVDTLNFGLYASYDTNCGFFAEANLGFGFTWNDEDERIVGGGRRGGEFETSSFQLGATAGYAFQLPAAFRIIPTLGLQYIHVDQDEYAQSGNVLAMWRDSSAADYLEIPVAVRVNRTFELGGGVSITPELRAAWILEAKQDDVSVRTGFVGSNASMLVSGTNPGRHRGLVGAGVKARLGGAVDAFLNYNLEFRNRYTNHNIMAGVGVSF